MIKNTKYIQLNGTDKGTLCEIIKIENELVTIKTENEFVYEIRLSVFHSNYEEYNYYLKFKGD